MCIDKRNERLGVEDFSKLNKDLLRKWNWRFANKWESPWRIAIREV